MVENSTSDVRSCLDKAVTGGTYATKDRDGAPVMVNFTAAGNKAVGVLAMDHLGSSKTTGNWQFRSLDGAGTITWDTAPVGSPAVSGTGKFPTLASYLDATWDLQAWISFNTPTPTDRPSTTSGGKEFFLSSFLERAQDPFWRTGSFVEGGIPGGIYTTGQLLRAAYSNGNQCAPYNRNL